MSLEEILDGSRDYLAQKKYYLVSASLVVVGHVLDAVSSAMLFSKLGKIDEFNPLIDYWVEKTGYVQGMLLTKGPMIFLGLALLYSYYEKGNRRIVTNTLNTVAGITVTISGFTTYLYYQ